MCFTKPRYILNNFHLFLASLFSPGSISDEEANLRTNLFEEGEDDVISGRANLLLADEAREVQNPHQIDTCEHKTTRAKDKPQVVCHAARTYTQHVMHTRP